MAKVEGLSSVLKALGDRIEGARKEGSPKVRVSFTAAHAFFVHENRTAHHETGQAGFLLDSARDMAGDLAGIVAGAMKRGLALTDALLLAGLRLQREAQTRCPVDTGLLRSSAQTTLEAR
jgi:hypothetical protein